MSNQHNDNNSRQPGQQAQQDKSDNKRQPGQETQQDKPFTDQDAKSDNADQEKEGKGKIATSAPGGSETDRTEL